MITGAPLGLPSLWSTYVTEIDRESAREMLADKVAAAAAAAAAEAGRPPAPPPRRPKGAKKQKDGDAEGAVIGYLKSRESRSMVDTVARGLFGLLKKR